jgi:hypothetical protein
MKRITISYQNGQTKETLLAGVPRVGEFIRLNAEELPSPTLRVMHILWQEASDNELEPTIIVVVTPQEKGPMV